MVRFSKDELYWIEKTADEQAAIASRNIHRLAEQFLIAQSVKGSPEILKGEIMKNIEEHAITSCLLKSIRDKLERERLK